MSKDGREDGRKDDRKAGREGAPTGARSPLTRRQILDLILRTYRASFPYMLLVVLVLLIVTWVFTGLIF